MNQRFPTTTRKKVFVPYRIQFGLWIRIKIKTADRVQRLKNFPNAES
jgi:hypothetical protein